MRGDVSKLIFIDSTVATDGRDTTKVMLPQQFSTGVGEKMSLSLVSFTMRRNWYNINATNNKFYIFVGGVHYVVRILPGVYAKFTTLAVAIGKAATLTIASIAEISDSVITYYPLTRTFGLQFQMADDYLTTNVQVRCYAKCGVKCGVKCGD